MHESSFRYVYEQALALQKRQARCAGLVEQVKALPWEKKEESPLCEGAAVAVIAKQDRYGNSLRAGLCLESGLIFLMDRLTTEGYADFYRGYYRPFVSQYWGRPFDLETFRQESIRYGEAVFESIASRLVSSSTPTLLDIGGSTGHVAQVFAERAGYHATVLDPSPDELQVAADRGLSVAEGFLETYDAQGQQFDLVLLCQTIDHLLDLRGSLEQIYNFVKPGGLFFVDIVDFDEECYQGASVEAALHLDHCYYLSQETALWLFASMGWDVVQVDIEGLWTIHVRYLLRKSTVASDRVAPPSNVLERLRTIQRLKSVQTIAPSQSYSMVIQARKRVHRARKSFIRKLRGQ